ncbi:hypothetical protein EDD18DRAFT_1121265 [Armillaria luteobubalina]|uniref:Secreted protein n=1 Tax=Armillaria luteobubalina TaxID=153913 RepID=A0AA39V0G6_9AGAR|nr:hypothetical protein EDD18DRAFT_1121265 [Armillaria luteobubalina]
MSLFHSLLVVLQVMFPQGKATIGSVLQAAAGPKHCEVGHGSVTGEIFDIHTKCHFSDGEALSEFFGVGVDRRWLLCTCTHENTKEKSGRQ